MLDSSVLQNTQAVQLPNPLAAREMIQRLQLGQLQQQDVSQQIQQRQADVEAKNRANMQASAATKLMTDSVDQWKQQGLSGEDIGTKLTSPEFESALRAQGGEYADKLLESIHRTVTSRSSEKKSNIENLNAQDERDRYAAFLKDNGYQDGAFARMRYKVAADPGEAQKAAQTAAETASAAKTGVETQEIQQRLGNYPQSPDDLNTRLLAIFGNNQNHPTYQNYKKIAAATPFSGLAAQKLLEEAQKETSATRQAVTTAQAEIPGKIQTATAVAQAMQGNDPRLQGVAIKDQEKAKDAYLKAGQAFDSAQSAKDRIDKTLKLAMSGNKEAQASASLIGVQAINELANVKRVNSAEIAAYGNAGSLIDNLEGSLGKIVAGKPIPPAVLQDMQKLHDELASNATPAYSRSVGTINRTYNSKFETAAPGGTVKMVAPNGQERDVPADQVEHYKSLGAKVKP